MKEKTEVKIPKAEFSIGLNDNIFSAGSCFSIEFGKYLKSNGIRILSNPFGTIYNSYSIHMLFKKIIDRYIYTEKDLFYDRDFYYSLEHSTEFDNENIEISLSKINKTILKSYEYLKKSNIFIITLGTSVVFIHKLSGKITANCHKLPESLFLKKILNTRENSDLLNRTVGLIKKVNHNAKIIFTISPVRHNPDNLVNNSLSKSILRVSIENIINNNDIIYFPSYEIVMDELRDYRYYKDDMLHINRNTINFIMEKFKISYMNNEINKYSEEYSKIKKMMNHKASEPGSADHTEFLQKILKKLLALSNKKMSELIDRDIFLVCIDIYKYNKDSEAIKNFVLENIKSFKKIHRVFYMLFSIEEFKPDEIEQLLSKRLCKNKKIEDFLKKRLLFYYSLMNDFYNFSRIFYSL